MRPNDCLDEMVGLNLKNRDRPTLLSVNRFEKKKNAALAIDAFASLRKKLPEGHLADMRLVLAGENVGLLNRCLYADVAFRWLRSPTRRQYDDARTSY